MVVIVRPFAVSVECLSQLDRLPSVDELRPSSCPLCDEPARPPGAGLRIVGHGKYRRQVLGLLGGCRSVVIWVRRFLCRGCRRTISVLPDALYPGRWYAVAAILLSLVLSLLSGEPAPRIRSRFTDAGESRGWKTLERWRRQLLSPLWHWLALQLGYTGPPPDRQGCKHRLTRLMSLHGGSAESDAPEIEELAHRLVAATAHVGAIGWDHHRGRPGNLSIPSPR